MSDDEEATYVHESGLAAQAHYHFPIHVVMVGDVGEETKSEIEARIWDKLNSALT